MHALAKIPATLENLHNNWLTLANAKASIVVARRTDLNTPGNLAARLASALWPLVSDWPAVRVTPWSKRGRALPGAR